MLKTLPNIQDGDFGESSYTAFSLLLFSQKATFYIFRKILNSPLSLVTTCRKSFISDVWQKFWNRLCSHWLFLQKDLSYMFDTVLNRPLQFILAIMRIALDVYKLQVLAIFLLNLLNTFAEHIPPYIYTAWKVSKYWVFSGQYFPVFGLNT